MASQSESFCSLPTSHDHKLDAVSSLDECLGEEGSSGSVEVPPGVAISLLSRLKAPRPSDLARKRKVATNPPKGKRSCRGLTATEPKNITVYHRVKEFPEEPLSASHGKLFCNAYREEMSLKMSIVRNHIRSAKHKEGCKRLKRKESREKSIADALAAQNKHSHLKGETLPASQ